MNYWYLREKQDLQCQWKLSYIVGEPYSETIVEMQQNKNVGVEGPILDLALGMFISYLKLWYICIHPWLLGGMIIILISLKSFGLSSRGNSVETVI